MFAKLYNAASSSSASAGVPPRIVMLHGLMGSGRNWAGVARRMTAKASQQDTKESASFLSYNPRAESCIEKKLVPFSAVSSEVVTLDWRNHGRSVHQPDHGLDFMAADLDFIFRKVNNVSHLDNSHNNLCTKKKVNLEMIRPDDYGSVNDKVDENSLPWKGLQERVVGSRGVSGATSHVVDAISASHQKSSRKVGKEKEEDLMWYIPFNQQQKDYSDRLRKISTVSAAVLSTNTSSSLLESNNRMKHRQPLILMAHSMGGAALMHFLVSHYAPEWEKHLQRRASLKEKQELEMMRSRLFQSTDSIMSSQMVDDDFTASSGKFARGIDDLSPEDDELFPYIPIDGVVIVDIGPCARPSYAQKLGGAVVAVKSLPIPQKRRRAVGDLFLKKKCQQQQTATPHKENRIEGAQNDNSPPPDKADPFAAAASSENLVVPPPPTPFDSRSSVEKHLLAKGPREIFDPKNTNSVWLARYLLTNVVEGEVEAVPWNETVVSYGAPSECIPGGKEGLTIEPNATTPAGMDEDATVINTSTISKISDQQQILITIDLMQRSGTDLFLDTTAAVTTKTHWEPNIDVIVRDLPKNTWRLQSGFTSSAKASSQDLSASSSSPDGHGQGMTALKGIKTLFVFGADSPYWLHTEARTEVYKYFPEAEVRLVPGAGHFVMIEKQQDFSQVIRQFISEVS